MSRMLKGSFKISLNINFDRKISVYRLLTPGASLGSCVVKNVVDFERCKRGELIKGTFFLLFANFFLGILQKCNT